MKNMKLILIFLCSFVSFSFGFSCSTEEECSNNGYCFSGKCNCYEGYFDSDCSQSILDKNRSGVITVQIIFSVLFASLTALSCFAFYRAVDKHRRSGDAFASNVGALVFAVYSVSLFTEFLYCAIDPLMVWKTVPYVVVNLFYTFNYPLGIIALMGILFHWIDLINTSVETLKKEAMMQKINKFYKGKDITLEDMVEKVQFLRKLRIPFIIVGVSVFVILNTFSTLQGLLIKPGLSAQVSGPVIVISYLVLCIGFLYYGRKLTKLIPYQLTKKVQRLTRKLSGYCIAVIVIVATLVVALRSIPNGKSPSYAFARFIVIEICVAALIFGALSIFFNWKSKFPFITFTEKTLSSHSGNATLQSSYQGNTEDEGPSIIEMQDESL